MDSSKKYDVLTFGRSSIDLYSNDIGAPFEEITSFGAFVGGSSTNIAVSCSRLSLHTALLTAIGDDQVGKFIMRFLQDEGIVTSYIPTVEGRTSAVILGIEPPDRFPLVYYRNNAADLQITIDHVLETGLDQFKVIVLSGNALSRDPSKTSTLFAAEHANQIGVPLFLDLDFRADQWFDPRAYGVMVRALLPRVKVVIGTEEEVLAASLRDSSQVTIKHQQISAPEIKGNIDTAIQTILERGVEVLIVKRGSDGCSVFEKGKSEVRVPGFPVEVLNVLGAGDAFAGGFTYGFLQGWDWYKACRMGNACGAIVVTRHGCANFMPTLDEVHAFVDNHGGF
ncbi:MAG: 5-dehydro-2-deoxygluconokinase [Rhodothermaceae bacterium]|nr:5-dehydro-2-deoxygluconokinase [Rhodothermaceae bacterium]